MAFSGIIPDKEHKPTILKRTMANGKVTVYTDEKEGAERAEILTPTGSVVIIKDYEAVPTLAKFKRIVVYGMDKDVLGTITIIQEGEPGLHPVYKFYDNNQQIGIANGDLVAIIAQKLLGADIIDPRFVTGAEIDDEVIETINRMLPRKTEPVGTL